MMRLLAVFFLVLVLSFGCSEEDNPVNGGETAKCDVTSPNNAYDVKTSDLVVVVDDYGDIPPEYAASVDEWLAGFFGSTEDTQWNVMQSAVTLTKTETPMCAPMIYVYNPIGRSCTVEILIPLENVDVTSLDLCQTFPNPLGELFPDIEVCLTEISIVVNVDPELVWSEDFSTFSGTEEIGSAQDPADVSVTFVVSPPGLPVSYDMQFHASRTVNGICCAGCKVCQ